MIRSNPNARRTIRQQLDDLESCIKVCLEKVHDANAFLEMTRALCAVARPTLAELVDNLQGYKVELPINSEEHKDVVWMKEKDKFAGYAEDFKNHYLTGEKFPPVVKMLEDLSTTLELVKKSFQAFTNSELFADYCEREYAYYKMYGWNRKLDDIIDDMSEDFTSDDACEYYKEQLETYLKKLYEESSKLVDMKNRIIYQEALGHKVWAKAHKIKDPTPVDELLSLAAAAEYFGNQAGTPVTFIPKKINPNQQNEGFDGMTIEERKLAKDKEKLALIKNNRLTNTILHTCWTKNYYGKHLSDEFFADLYNRMFAEESLISTLCNKFSERTRLSSICRVIGECWNAKLYKPDAKAQDIADVLHMDNQLEAASRARYIRDAFPEDDPLGVWVRNNLPNRVNGSETENPTQPNDQVGNVEG